MLFFPPSCNPFLSVNIYLCTCDAILKFQLCYTLKRVSWHHIPTSMRFSGSATKRKPFPSRGVVPSLNAGTAPHSDSIPPFPGGKRELTWSRTASFSYKLLRDSVFRSCVVPTTTNSIFLEILNRFQRPYETKKKNPVVQMEKLNHKDQITNKPAQSQLQSLGVERQA